MDENNEQLTMDNWQLTVGDVQSCRNTRLVCLCYNSNIINTLRFNQSQTARAQSRSLPFGGGKVWWGLLQHIGDGLWERREVVEHGLAVQVGGGKGVVAVA